jgi:uncharacterized protein (UPF0264 family)
MTQLLVSVRSAVEARAAIAGGADIIDVKEPDNGSLGRASDQVIDQVMSEAADSAPVSAAMGELAEKNTAPPITDWVKAGLAGASDDWRHQLVELCDKVGRDRFIAVVYADAQLVAAPPTKQIITWAIKQKVAGVLIDTSVKDGKNLFDWCADDLPGWIDALQQQDMMIALAGSLHGKAFQKAVALKPNIVAVRGAACDGNDRCGLININKVQQLKQTIEQHTAPPAAHAG